MDKERKPECMLKKRHRKDLGADEVLVGDLHEGSRDC